MRRVFSPGDIIETRPILFEEVRRGDVIVFSRDGEKIVHRVLRRDARSLVTIGDNNNRRDAWSVTRGGAELELAVRRIDRRKRRCKVYRGCAGMTVFYINRFRRFVRRAAGFAVRKLSGAASGRVRRS